MHDSHPTCTLIVGKIWLAAVIALMAALGVLPARGQNAVPPTARQAAQMPPFAQKLAHPQTTGKPPANSAGPRSPQDAVIYENGPMNGTVDAWTINFGYIVANSFPQVGKISSFDFYVWMFPGDKPLTVDWSITSQPFGGTTYSSGTAQLTDSFISVNQYGYEMHKETASGIAGTAGDSNWLNLQNATTSQGNPLYWDENSGTGCHSPACPSLAWESALGSIPSEAFDLTGGQPANCFDLPQHFQILHSYTAKEGSPGGLIQGREGYFGGLPGGQGGAGWIYKTSSSTGWKPIPVYSFDGGYNGGSPSSLISGPDGALYGVARGGIQNCGKDGQYYCGLIFRIPSSVACRTDSCGWGEEVPYRKSSDTDPMPGDIVGFDPQGNLYGSCYMGGGPAICELIQTDQGWRTKLLYNFTDFSPTSLLRGDDGNFYGTNWVGAGQVFQIVPAGDGWKVNILHQFDGQSEGNMPQALVQDRYGNLFGHIMTQSSEWLGDSVFKLSPSNNGWEFRITWQTGPSEGMIAFEMDPERNGWVGGIAVGGGCGGRNCSGDQKPTGPPYFYGFFDGYIRFRGNGLLWLSGLVLGPGGQSMLGTTSECGDYNEGTLWQWQIH